ncbi:MAG TPA: phosphoglucosamine mutase [candidate division Zixibacteria bacterium]
MKDKLIVGISGLRGVVGKTLFPETALGYALAFGILCHKGKVVVARDSRVSGKVLKRAAVSGLLSVGCDVVDLGICPTPTLTLATEKLGAVGGICITASHNPFQWNGMKFVEKDGTFLNKKKMEKLNLLVQKTNISHIKKVPLCKLSPKEDWYKKHIDYILKLGFVQKDKIRKANLKVVVDCNNGAGSRIAPLLLRKLGCKIVELNCDFSKSFAHAPEPTVENLLSLAKVVRDKNADVGFCLDPDGDRLSLVADEGTPLSEEYTLALATRFILSKNPKEVVINLSTSRMTQEVAEKSGCKVYRTPVGEYNVAKKLKEIKGVIGGEGNGGVILPELHYTRDALVGMALIVEYLAESNRKLSQIIQDMPKYFMLKKKIEVSKDFDDRLEGLIKRFKKERINKKDGIRIDFKDSWLHIRKSNTEPAARIIAEAKTKKTAEDLAKEGLELLT